MATTYTVAEYLDALGTDGFEAGSQLIDTAQAIRGLLDGRDLTNLGAITITDDTFSLTLPQYKLLSARGWTLEDGQTFTLEVTAAELIAVDDAHGSFSQFPRVAYVDTASGIEAVLADIFWLTDLQRLSPA